MKKDDVGHIIHIFPLRDIVAIDFLECPVRVLEVKLDELNGVDPKIDLGRYFIQPVVSGKDVDHSVVLIEAQIGKLRELARELLRIVVKCLLPLAKQVHRYVSLERVSDATGNYLVSVFFRYLKVRDMATVRKRRLFLIYHWEDKFGHGSVSRQVQSAQNPIG